MDPAGSETGQSSSSRSSTLKSKLSTLLPRETMDLIEKDINEFIEGKIPEEELIMRVRQVAAGDEMLFDIFVDYIAERYEVRLSLVELEASIEERTPATSTSSRPASGEHNEGST